ncbi:MAG: polysaccharide pyruvyl transferase family protein [Halobacteriaceae archaeon]
MTDSALVLGYFGFGNAGDDAIGVAIIQQLVKRSTLDRVVATTGPKPVFKRSDIQTISYSIGSIFTSIAKVDRVIMTGGTHFHTQGKFYDRLKVFSFYILTILWAKIWRTEVDLLAHGVGPLEGRFYRSLAKLVMLMVDNISVRDQQSLEIVKSLGRTTSASPILGFDVAPLLNRFSSQSPLQSENEKDTSRADDDLTLGISLTPAFAKYYDDPKKDDELVEEVADTIRKIAYDQHQINKVIIFVLHTGDFNDDISLSRDLVSELDELTTELRSYQNNPESFITAMDDVDRFIGMKYHSIVFSFLQEIPTLAISYHPKCQWFQEYVGYTSNATVSMQDVVDNGIQEEMEELVSAPGRFQPTMTIDEAQVLAQRSFEAVPTGGPNL